MSALPPLLPELQHLVDAMVESEWFLAHTDIKIGLEKADHHSLGMLLSFIEAVAPGLKIVGEEAQQRTFQTLIQACASLPAHERARHLSTFLDLAIDPRQVPGTVVSLSNLYGEIEMIEGHRALAAFLDQQPTKVRHLCGRQMAEKMMKERLTSSTSSRNIRPDHPHHPLRTVLSLLKDAPEPTFAELGNWWADFTFQGDLFGDLSPEAGEVLRKLVEIGVDPDRCMHAALTQGQAASTERAVLVENCLDAGANYETVLRKYDVQQPILDAIWRHPSYRRVALEQVADNTQAQSGTSTLPRRSL